jgi:hypothetical protein
MLAHPLGSRMSTQIYVRLYQYVLLTMQYAFRFPSICIVIDVKVVIQTCIRVAVDLLCMYAM